MCVNIFDFVRLPMTKTVYDKADIILKSVVCVCLLNATYNTSAVYKVHFAFFNNSVIKLIY